MHLHYEGKRMKTIITRRNLLLLCIICLIGYSANWCFFDIQRLNGQELISESKSPDGTYLVKAYRNNQGATSDFAVLCTLENISDGNVKNIYWHDACDSADIKWMDDDTVKINGITLQLPYQTYDYRHD